jgi:hypothetical protein
MRNVVIAIAVLTLAAFIPTLATGQTYFKAVIDGAQEVPPTPSPGTGLGCFMLDANNMLHYEVSYTGMMGAETAAHIHGPAPIGANAGVVFPFALGTPKIGSFGPLTAVEVADLSNGLYYVNIHSQIFPGGEIRGQILTSGSPCTVPVENRTWGVIKSIYDVE